MGKHKKMKIIIVIVLVLAAIICICIAKRAISNHILDGPGMVNTASVISLEYYKGGDEYGRSTSIRLTDDGLLKYDYDGGTVEESVTKVCRPDVDFDTSLENIVAEYDVRSWVDLPASDLEILDGATVSVTIKFADGITVKLGDRYEMPDNAWKAVSEITDLCESCIEENENITETEKKQE